MGSSAQRRHVGVGTVLPSVYLLVGTALPCALTALHCHVVAQGVAGVCQRSNAMYLLSSQYCHVFGCISLPHECHCTSPRGHHHTSIFVHHCASLHAIVPAWRDYHVVVSTQYVCSSMSKPLAAHHKLEGL